VGSISLLQRQQSDRSRSRTRVESMWADAAAQNYFGVVADLEQADRQYMHALLDLDRAFKQAHQMLGP
jgi:uncharacterized protein YukE